MVEWCQRIFENRTNSGHVIDIAEAKIKRVKPFTLKTGELYRMG
jgi:hypothetical protein